MDNALKDRLAQARRNAGFKSVRAACERFGWAYPTYAGHENGSRSPGPETVAEYAAAFGVSRGWLQFGAEENASAPAPAPMISEDSETGLVQVKVYDLSASAGGGALVEAERPVDEVAFAPRFLRSMTMASPRQLSIISVKGDSMEPTLLDGDQVLVDMSKTNPDFDGLFVLRYGDALHVKRIGRHRKAGWVTITSDNDAYRQIEAEYHEVAILGRVIWFGRKM